MPPRPLARGPRSRPEPVDIDEPPPARRGPSRRRTGPEEVFEDPKDRSSRAGPRRPPPNYSERRESTAATEHLRAGIRLCSEGQYEEARRRYIEALRESPDDEVVANNLGVVCDALDQHEQSIRWYDRATEINPDYETAWYNKANAFTYLGKFDRAEHSYKRALAIRQEYPAAMYELAVCQALQGAGNPLKSNEARRTMDRAVARWPKSEEAWLRKGLLLEEQERFDQAEECYQRAVALAPRNPEAWNVFGNFYFGDDRLEEALNAYDVAITLASDNEEAWNNRGFALFVIGDIDAAIRSYDRSIELNPQYKHAWYNKGYTLQAADRLEEALECYRMALKLDPMDEVVWNNLGNVLYNLHRYRDSLPFFVNAISVNEEYEIAWNNLGNALDRMGLHSRALKYHERALELNPRFDYALYAKGKCLTKMGRPVEGIPFIQRSLEITPDYDRAWLALAEAQLATGAVSDGMDCLSRASGLNPDLAEAWEERAKLLEALGAETDAAEAWLRAMLAYEKTFDARRDYLDQLRLAKLYERLGRLEEAVETYRDVVTNHHQMNEGFEGVARCLLAIGRHDSVVAWWTVTPDKHRSGAQALATAEALLALGSAPAALRILGMKVCRTAKDVARLARLTAEGGSEGRALQMLSGREDLDSVLMRANLLARQGREREAAEELRAAEARGTTSGELMIALGTLLLETGDAAGAGARAERALALEPASAESWLLDARVSVARGRPGQAITSARRAAELDPGNPEVEEFLVELTAAGKSAIVVPAVTAAIPPPEVHLAGSEGPSPEVGRSMTPQNAPTTLAEVSGAMETQQQAVATDSPPDAGKEA